MLYLFLLNCSLVIIYNKKSKKLLFYLKAFLTSILFAKK